MDLSTTYLSLSLPHPLMPGSSPLVDDLDMVKRLEDAGAAAIVMHSLFEEHITGERARTLHQIETHANSFAEAPSYFPDRPGLSVGPEPYLEQIRRIKAAVHVPVIGSLNGTTATGWLDYAGMIQQAGADALELNFYVVATDPLEHGEAVEQRALDILRKVKASVTIPVAVKLSPFFGSFAHIASQLDGLGQTDSCSSIASISPISTWRRWRSCPGCTSPIRPNSCSGCAGWRSSPDTFAPHWRSPVACIPPWMPSRPSWPGLMQSSWCQRCSSTGRSVLKRFERRWSDGWKSMSITPCVRCRAA